MNASNEKPPNTDIVILLVSGSCCLPGLAVHDQQAQQVIEQVLADTGIAAVIKIVPVSSALQGGILSDLLNGMDLQAQRANLTRLPALFINGKLIGFGIPEPRQVKSILLSLQEKTV